MEYAKGRVVRRLRLVSYCRIQMLHHHYSPPTFVCEGAVRDWTLAKQQADLGMGIAPNFGCDLSLANSGGAPPAFGAVYYRQRDQVSPSTRVSGGGIIPSTSNFMSQFFGFGVR
ncbi:hypothetical protein CX682_29780 [Pseudomonas sp. FFUP_PS_41]|nr:hypothetical protein CX682_29780 [Pseudomonas sp. FFUP_PS_41]